VAPAGNVDFRVGPDGAILLDPGFEVQEGGVFDTVIDPAP
jgi:hypothetical protein